MSELRKAIDKAITTQAVQPTVGSVLQQASVDGPTVFTALQDPQVSIIALWDPVVGKAYLPTAEVLVEIGALAFAKASAGANPTEPFSPTVAEIADFVSADFADLSVTGTAGEPLYVRLEVPEQRYVSAGVRALVDALDLLDSDGGLLAIGEGENVGATLSAGTYYLRITPAATEELAVSVAAAKIIAVPHEFALADGENAVYQLAEPPAELTFNSETSGASVYVLSAADKSGVGVLKAGDTLPLEGDYPAGLLVSVRGPVAAGYLGVPIGL